MIENWMVTLAITVITAAFGYGLFRGKLNAQEKEHEELKTVVADNNNNVNTKMDAQFKRIDETADRCTKLETQIVHLLSMQEAESKFVAKTELALHLKNIDNELSHINKTNEAMLGKLEDLSEAFSNYLLGASNANK